MRLRTLLTNISGVPGVSSSGTVTIEVPANARYHAIILQFFQNGALATAAQIATALTNCRFEVNGNLMRQFSGTQGQQILLVNGETLKDGYLPVYFSEPWRADVMDEEVTSWDLKGQRTFNVYLDLTTPATAFSVGGVKIYDYKDNTIDGKPFVRAVKWIRQAFNANSGEADFDQIPKSRPIQRIHAFAASAALQRIRVRSDSVEIFDQTFAQNAQAMAAYGMVQQTDSLPMIFDYNQQLRDALPVIGRDGLPLRDLNIKLTMGTAQTVTFITEQLAEDYV